MARDGDELVFVEVSARDGAEAGFPPSAASARRRESCERAAVTYLAERGADEGPVRFDDVALVAVGPGRALLRHHINSLSACEDALTEVV